MTETDLISRQDAIDALWKALYEYEDKTEKQFQESDELDVGDWFQHRIFVQNMSDIDRQTILDLPSAQTDLSGYSDRLWKRAYASGYEQCRQEAIELVHSLYPSAPIVRMNRERWKEKYKSYIEVEKMLEMLPSAQPEDVIHVTGRRKFVSEFDFDEVEEDEIN